MAGFLFAIDGPNYNAVTLAALSTLQKLEATDLNFKLVTLPDLAFQSGSWKFSPEWQRCVQEARNALADGAHVLTAGFRWSAITKAYLLGANVDFQEALFSDDVKLWGKHTPKIGVIVREPAEYASINEAQKFCWQVASWERETVLVQYPDPETHRMHLFHAILSVVFA